MRPEYSIRRRPGRPGRTDGHHDRRRRHGLRCLAGRVESLRRLAGDHQYERDGPRSRRTRRGAMAGLSLTRSVLDAPSPSDHRSRSCRRLTREEYGHLCLIVEVERRSPSLPLRRVGYPRSERVDEYRCYRCDWFDVSVPPSRRMNRHRCLWTAHSTHLWIDPLVPPAWPFPLRHWSSIALTGRDDQAGRNQQAWAELRRARGLKVPVPRASPMALMPPPRQLVETEASRHA
jgi:hypothetical protein